MKQNGVVAKQSARLGKRAGKDGRDEAVKDKRRPRTSLMKGLNGYVALYRKGEGTYRERPQSHRQLFFGDRI